MIDVYVLNKNLEPVGVIENYRSLIWANRYWDIGDCELYLPATQTNLDLLQMGYYLHRLDDDMVCQIRKIEVDTDIEAGNYLIVTGTDAKALLDQRIYFQTMYLGEAERALRQVTLYSTSYNMVPLKTPMRKPDGTLLLKAGDYNGFGLRLDSQRRFFNVGELWREVCRRFNWGYRIRLDGGQLAYEVYAGSESSGVTFSPEFENLASTTYVRDRTNMGNAAIVAGAGEGTDRRYIVLGQPSGENRFEIYVDARDLQREVTYADLLTAYPGGSIRGSAEVGYTYYLTSFDVLITDDIQLNNLQSNYPNGIIVVLNDGQYYRVFDIDIADLPTDSPDNDTPIQWRDIVYDTYLIARGLDKLKSYGETTTFNGSVIPNVTFKYKSDYNLGDIVEVKNEFGLSAFARIVEVVEVMDDNGYSLEPKFEYITEV